MATGRVSYAQATAASRAGVSSSGGGNEGLTSGRPQERIPTCTVVDTQARNSTNYADGDDGKGRKNTAYEAALSSARLSAFDARTGNVRCVPCGKAFGSYKSLAVHLLAKHGGSNTLEAKFFNVNVPPTAARSMNSGGGGGSAAAAGAGAGGGGGASGAGVRKTQRERLQESSLLDFDALMRKGKGTKSHGTPTTSAASLGAGSGSGHRLNAHVKPSVGNGTAKVKNFKGRLVETTTTTTIPSDEGGAGHATTTTTTTTIEVQKKKKRPSILKRLIVNERKSKEYQNAIALVRKLEAEKDAKADVVAWHDADVRLVEKMLEVALTRWSATPAPAIACERTSEHEKHVAEDIDVDSVLSGLDAHLASVGVEKRGQAGAGHAAVSAPNVDACGVELPLVTEDEVLCIDLRIARDVLREKKRDSARLYDVADGKLQEAERVRASLEEEYAKKQKENEEKREQCVPVEPVDEGNAHGDDKGDNIDDGDDDGRQELDMVALQHRPQSAEATSEMYTSSDAPTTTHAASDVDTVDDPCTRQATASDATVLSDANEACDDDESRRSEPISSCGTKLSADGTADTDADVPCTAREDDDSTRDPSGGLDSVQPVCPDASMGGEKMQAIFDALAPSYSRTASNQVHCLLCPSCCTSAMDYLRHITGAKHRKAIQRVALAIVSRDNVLESNVRCAPDVMRSRVQTTPAVSGRVRTNAVPGDGMRYTGKMGDYAPYVFQTISPLLNEKVTELIGLLVKWQRRVKEREPHNIKRKMRIVNGMREVGKYSKLGKLKCLIVAPNIEQMEAKGSLDDRIKTMLDAARVASSTAFNSSSMNRQKTDVVFALTRQKLGKAVDAVAVAAVAAASGSSTAADVRRHHNSRPTKISVLGILDYGGAEREYKEVMRLVEEGRKEFAERLEERARETHESNMEVTATAAAITTGTGVCADNDDYVVVASSLAADDEDDCDDDFHVILSKSPTTSSTADGNIASIVPSKPKLRADAPIFTPLACNR